MYHTSLPEITDSVPGQVVALKLSETVRSQPQVSPLRLPHTSPHGHSLEPRLTQKVWGRGVEVRLLSNLLLAVYPQDLPRADRAPPRREYASSCVNLLRRP